MRALSLLVLLCALCAARRPRNRSDETYTCGQYPNVYYSQSPCNDQYELQPGDRCRNGGLFLGWSCQSSYSTCQFSTPSGPLNGHCVDGYCCTIAGQINDDRNDNRNRCPSNMERTNQYCSNDVDCNVNSYGRQQDRGICSGGQCCFRRSSRNGNSNNQCRQNEILTNRKCSRINPCQRNSFDITVVCRSGYCCESDSNNNQGICRGGNPVMQSDCNYDGDCNRFSASNQRATCDTRYRKCCVNQVQCPRGATPQYSNCQGNYSPCGYRLNNIQIQGTCYGNGMCCPQ